MKRILAGLAVLMVLGLPAAAQTMSLMTADHPLYDAKVAGEAGVENMAPNASVEAEAKLDHATKRAEEANQLAAENKTEHVNATADAYNEKMQEVNDLGDRVSDLAQQQKIDELVATATAHHADVLSQVYERVPAEAKEGIERALNNSVDAHQKAMDAMEARGQSTAGVPNISANIPASVRDATGVEAGPSAAPGDGADGGSMGPTNDTSGAPS